MRRENKARVTVAAILLAAAVILFFTIKYIVGNHPVWAGENQPIRTIVVDAGHGGIDGGTTGIGGVVEKHLNLQIAQKLEAILQVNGYEVVMTRNDDQSIHSFGKTIAQQKKSDMNNRLKLINNTSNAIAISIHQNYYQEERYSGAQMFYGGKNEASKLLAEAIQKRFVEQLQKDNTRQVKEAGKNLYLMYEAKNPIVLVECGFLSNPVEAALLSDDTYQNKVAFTIFSGLVDYLDTK